MWRDRFWEAGWALWLALYNAVVGAGIGALLLNGGPWEVCVVGGVAVASGWFGHYPAHALRRAYDDIDDDFGEPPMGRPA